MEDPGPSAFEDIKGIFLLVQREEEVDIVSVIADPLALKTGFDLAGPAQLPQLEL